MLAELPPTLSNALIGLVAIGLFFLFWASSRGARTSDTVLMRLTLLLLLTPFVAAAVLSILPNLGPPRPAATTKPAPTATAPEATTQTRPPQPPRQETAQRPTPPPAAAPPLPAPPAPPVPTAPAAPPTASSTPPAASSTPPPSPTPPVVAVAPTPPAATAPAEPPSPRRSPEPPAATPPPADTAAAPPAVPAPAPAPAPAAAPVASEPWDVVPVYYGTDRKADGTATPPVYSADRARRLELGRALVTVPKVHEIPVIERPWVYRLPFTEIVLFREKEDPAKHFTLKELKAMSREELARIVRDRLAASTDFRDQALIFLHGFNNSFESALFRTAQIAYDLKFDGAPFMYSWPSKGQIGLQDYSYDRESSGQAEPYFREFLDFVMRESGAKTVNIIAHSMGNQLLLSALRDLKRAAPPDVTIGQIVFAAPDVDRDTFAFIAKEIAGIGRGITMLAASNDRALEASRRFWGGVPRAGDVPSEGPVIVEGIDTIDVTAVSTEVLALNHSGYAEKHQLLEDMRRLLKDGLRPPEKRLPALERITSPRGDFWRWSATR